MHVEGEAAVKQRWLVEPFLVQRAGEVEQRFGDAFGGIADYRLGRTAGGDPIENGLEQA